MNLVIFSGRAGKDPELMKGNAHGAKFSVASTERYKDKKSGEWKERVTWMNVQVWGKFADFVMKHVRKGDRVAVKGKLSVSEYNDKLYTNIIADVVEPSVFRKDAEPDQQGKLYGQAASEEDGPPFEGGGEDDDDTPF